MRSHGKAPAGASAEMLPAGVRMVRATNASPMTEAGTNTFIVGRGAVAVIDPGPADPAHLAAILGALAPGECVATIVVTHPHLDHSALAPALAAATGAPVHAFGPAGSGRSPGMARLMAAGLAGGGEGVDRAFRPDSLLADGAVLRGSDWELLALHTPGHMGEHLCLAFGDTLFSGDHVMGWAPSLVSPPEGDMGAYMASLDRLAATAWRRMLPAHGRPVDDPAARLAALAAHRRGREAQVLAAVRSGALTLDLIAAAAYAGTDPALMPAARQSALAHLIDLAARNLIEADPLPLSDARFRAA